MRIWYFKERQPITRLSGELVSDLVERAWQMNGSPELVGPTEYTSIGEFEQETGVSCWRIQRATYSAPSYNNTTREVELYSPTSYEVGIQQEHAGFSFPAQ